MPVMDKLDALVDFLSKDDGVVPCANSRCRPNIVTVHSARCFWMPSSLSVSTMGR